MSYVYRSPLIKNLPLHPITEDVELRRLLIPIHIAIFDLAKAIGSGGGGGGGQQFFFQAAAPTAANVGDEWMQSTTGIYYKYIDDGTSIQWVELPRFP